jgi:hypothetical protein
MGWGQAVMQLAGDIMQHNKNTDTNVDGIQTTKKNISQEAVDKIMYDILSSTEGLSSLATGEAGSGGFNSSSRGLLTQDLSVKLAGEIANLTAETVTGTYQKTEVDNQTPLAKGIGTIICTHMMNRGFLSRRDWARGHAWNSKLSDKTLIGYQFWSEGIVAHMEKNPGGLMERFWKPIVRGRYEMIVHKRFNLLGASTIYLMEPFSFFVGLMIGVEDGRFQHI